MKIIEYGHWTLALNVENSKKDYCLIYKGHLTPSWRDVATLGGPVYHLINGKRAKMYGSVYDCPDVQERTDFQAFDPFKTYRNYPGASDLLMQPTFMTCCHLDIIL